MKIKPNRKQSIFFAFPWNTLTRQQYSLTAEYLKNNGWNIYLGADMVSPELLVSEMENYRESSKQLFHRFVDNLKKSDLVIADITSLNPNVMIEVGIAIDLHKNILLLSGDSASKLPFDISGFQIKFYSKATDIKQIINKFIDGYLSIKQMSFEDKPDGNYFSVPEGIITCDDKAFGLDRSHMVDLYRITDIPELTLPRMKDLKIGVEFKIEKYGDPSDWFGFMFRSAENTGKYEPLFHGSVLVNSRVNGRTDITMYPGESIPRHKSTNLHHDGNTYQFLEIELDERTITVTGNNGSIQYDAVNLLNFGYLYLATYRTKTSFKNLRILNTTTVSEVA
jgi:hypothetical protein